MRGDWSKEGRAAGCLSSSEVVEPPVANNPLLLLPLSLGRCVSAILVHFTVVCVQAAILGSDSDRICIGRFVSNLALDPPPRSQMGCSAKWLEARSDDLPVIRSLEV